MFFDFFADLFVILILSLQNELQQALLSLGEFQSAIDELTSWLDRTLTLINQPPSIYSEVKTIDAELNDIVVSNGSKELIFLCGLALTVIAREMMTP